jgi:CBS-domain-containing membrane protein
MSWPMILWRALGGAIAILAMHFLAGYGHVPLMLVPFATSIVLVLGTPEVEPAQPRALVGGHLISTLVGLAFPTPLARRPGRRRPRWGSRWSRCISCAPFTRRRGSIR